MFFMQEYVFDFGKYKNLSVSEVAEKDINYLYWYLEEGEDDNIKDNIIYFANL